MKGPRFATRGWIAASALALSACSVMGSSADDGTLYDTTSVAVVQAESMTLPAYSSVFSDSSADGGKGIVMYRNGTATASFTLPSAATGLSVVARADLCNGGAQMIVSVDGAQVLSTTLSATSWATSSASASLAAGTHTLSIQFPNDYYGGTGCDRNLRVDRTVFTATTTPPAPDAGPPPGGGGGPVASFEAETMTRGSFISVFSDTAASGGRGIVYYQNGAATTSLSLPSAASSVIVRARADLCSGSPAMTLKIDRAAAGSATVSSTSWTDVTFAASVGAGAHAVEIDFTNDFYGGTGCDRNLRLDVVTFSGDGGGGGCVPTTCAELGDNCGMVSDGCGGTLDCGTCSGGQTCGGGGTPNVCGGGGGGGDVIIAAVGDINPSGVSGSTTNPGLTAQNIRNQSPAYFLALGDHQYTQGTLSAILGGYDKNFHDLYAITRPTPGPTHDIASATDQLGYKDYWKRDGFTPYSFDAGSWHIISMPSTALRYGVNVAGVQTWLQNDLAGNSKPCVLAFWHEPYWSRSTSTHPTGSNGILTSAERPWLDVLYQYRVDLILNGHQHNYQRFAPMRPDGTLDQAGGLREIISGAGGIGFYSFNGSAPNVEASNDNTYGILKVTLGASSYSWRFVSNSAGGFSDSGQTACH